MTARTINHIARYVLGGAFVLIGLNGFLQFLPAPPPPSSAALSFISALSATGYFMPLLKGMEVIAGLLLLGNRFVPLALALLAPVLVNIVAYHLFLEPATLPIPLVLLAAELLLAWSHRDAFAPMLRARVEPHGASPAHVNAHTAGAAA
jgi:hypothetical protein